MSTERNGIEVTRAAYSFAQHAQRLADAGDAAGQKGFRLFALVDCGQQPEIGQDLARRFQTCPLRWLFDGKFAGDAMDLSPLLIQLSDGGRTRLRIDGLSARCEDRPMMSLILSTLEIASLASTLQELLVIETDVGAAFLLRIADTRAIRAALDVLSPAQRAGVMNGISNWWLVDTRGRLTDLRTFVGNGERPAAMPLRFSSAQLDALIQASIVPITAAQLRQFDAPFARLRLAEQDDFVSRMTVRARDAGFGTESDAVAWCAAALRGGENFDEHPLVRMALVEASVDDSLQRLDIAFESLDDEAWADIRASARPLEPVAP